ncbi:hypothetical protein [uncultured Mediterranean phage uvDeep-CGR0-AD1-C123]|nr:hypothetical protein [uncultured Mediterranean phage uvDeep-CGR0-AD1-C123]
MTLKIVTGQVMLPPRIGIYGPPGVGKTTFAAGAGDKCIFIPTEEGADVVGVDRFPLCQSVGDVMSALDQLAKEKHDYSVVVIDSLDWFETLAWDQACQDAGVKSIEEIGGGYGKGYIAALAYHRALLGRLTQLRRERGMACVLLAHSQVKRFEDPTTEAFDRFEIKLHKRAADLYTEFVDLLGFANVKMTTRETTSSFGQKKVKAVGSGERVLRVASRPNFVAKTRYSISDELPLEWATLMAEIKGEKNG